MSQSAATPLGDFLASAQRARAEVGPEPSNNHPKQRVGLRIQALRWLARQLEPMLRELAAADRTDFRPSLSLATYPLAEDYFGGLTPYFQDCFTAAVGEALRTGHETEARFLIGAVLPLLWRKVRTNPDGPGDIVIDAEGSEFLVVDGKCNCPQTSDCAHIAAIKFIEAMPAR